MNLDKKQTIILTSMNLFYRHGIHAVGINEVIKESGVAKKTLYHHFESKEELIVATLEVRHNNFINWMKRLLNSQQGPRQSLINLFIGLDEWFNDKVEALGHFRGCYFINASAEYSIPGHPIFEACCQHKNDVYELILKQTKLLTNYQQKAEHLAYVLTTLKDGCISAALVKDERDTALKVISTVEKLIDGLD